MYFDFQIKKNQLRVLIFMKKAEPLFFLIAWSNPIFLEKLIEIEFLIFVNLSTYF